MEEILLIQEAVKTQQASTIERLARRTQDINKWVYETDIPGRAVSKQQHVCSLY
jgi:hypothetical protein